MAMERDSGVWLLRFGVAIALAAGSVSVCQVASKSTRTPPSITPVAIESGVRAVEVNSDRVFFAAPDGSASGDGSVDHPWNLATALAQPAAVQPGDTIWLRGGTYPGTFSSSLTGTDAHPIVVRQYPGERAILDGGNSRGHAILTVAGANSWYWGFEIMSSDAVRVSSTALDDPPDIGRGDGVTIDQSSATGPGLKFINLNIHDARQGISFWKEAIDAEIYGCLIYYNGWDSTARGSGHGIYTQNQTGTKKITDNILFSGFGYGIHAYGSSAAFLDNFLFQGNTIFNSGDLSSSGPSGILLVGGGRLAHNPQVVGNFLYRQTGGVTSDLDMGYSAGCVSPTLTGNYIATATSFVNCTAGLNLADNTFYGDITGFSQSTFPANTYFSLRPTGTQVFLRPNLYEPGRANITIYNWDLAPTVSVDLSSVLPIGSRYEIRNAQNFFAPPVQSGTYSGGTVSLPMTGLTSASPVGHAAPPPAGPEFQALILLTVSPPRQAFPAPSPHRPPTRVLNRTPVSK
jgi:hypothetical protein